MKIAPIQQHATADRRVLKRAASGVDEILYCEIDLAQVEQSHARRLFLRDRRPELFADWLGKETER